VTTADDYVNRVLDMMPMSMPSRAQIATELRGHIAERLADGHSLDEVLRQLGDPVTLADSYLAAEPLESAAFGERVAAKLIDFFSVFAVIVPLAWLVSTQVNRYYVPVFLIGSIVLGGSISFGVYTMVAEYRGGSTLGKRIRGLRVVSESGARISKGQAIVRQLPMFLQMCWIDAMFALFTEKSQRAFELLSKTRVVRRV
jgi:uncharacterized RDD family membrane protein YckC